MGGHPELQTRRNFSGRLVYLDAKQCGALIGRSAGAVRNLVYRQKIPYRKPAGKLVFLRSEIEAWIENSPGMTLDEIKEKTENGI